MECKVHKLVADVAAIAEGQVLMVKYGDVSRYDGQRGWFLPDDFLAHGEHPDDAARRILKEQAGLTGVEPRLGHIESFDGDAWHLIFHYRAQMQHAALVEPSGNVLEAHWFALERLPPPSELAHHGWALSVLGSMGVLSAGGVGKGKPKLVAHHALVWVSDMDRAVGFYTEALGLPLRYRDPGFAIIGGERFWVSLHLGARTPEERRRGEGPIIVFRPDDVDQAYEELRARGVEFFRGPLWETPTVRLAEFRDTEGNRLSISSAE